MDSNSNSNELAIAWIDLSYVLKNRFSRQTKQILFSLNGKINFHTLTALMGPSGSGKTSLLNCINTRNNWNFAENTKIYVNKTIPLRTSYITQNSIEYLVPGLTVRYI